MSNLDAPTPTHSAYSSTKRHQETRSYQLGLTAALIQAVFCSDRQFATRYRKSRIAPRRKPELLQIIATPQRGMRPSPRAPLLHMRTRFSVTEIAGRSLERSPCFMAAMDTRRTDTWRPPSRSESTRRLDLICAKVDIALPHANGKIESKEGKRCCIIWSCRLTRRCS